MIWLNKRTTSQLWTLFFFLTGVNQVSSFKLTNQTILISNRNSGGSIVVQHLIDQLIRRGNKVVVIDESYRDPAITPSTSIARYEGSVLDKTFLSHIFRVEQPSQICHIVDTLVSTNNNTMIHSKEDDPFLHIQRNIQEMVSLLTVAVDKNITESKFVYVTSASKYDYLYGSDNSEQQKDFILNPDVETSDLFHSATKKSGELFGYTWNHVHKVPFTSLRLYDSTIPDSVDSNVRAIMTALDDPSTSFDVVDLAISARGNISLATNGTTTKISSNRLLHANHKNIGNLIKSLLSRSFTGERNDHQFNDVSKSAAAIVPRPHLGHKTVLVTGAAGFVGSHVANYLLARGDTVIVVDEMNDYYNVSLKMGNLQGLSDKFNHTGRLKIYVGDIANATLMESIFLKERPAWICHMAARAGVRPRYGVL
jgi:nucleoside-diphosphate-sugar epimerase